MAVVVGLQAPAFGAESGGNRVTVPVTRHPMDPTLGAGGLWMVHPEDDVVTRIDPSTNTVSTIPDYPCVVEACWTTSVNVGRVARVYSDGEVLLDVKVVWTGALDGTIRMLDPRTGQMLRRGSIDLEIHDIEHAGGWLYVSGWDEDDRGVLYRIDPVTFEVLDRDLFASPPMLTQSGYSLWLLTYEGEVRSIEPSSGEEFWAMRFPGGIDIAGYSNSVLLLSIDGVVARVDPWTHELETSRRVFSRGFGHIATGSGAAWVVRESSGDRNIGTLVKIDPFTLEVTGSLPLPGRGFDVVAGGGDVWVTNGWGAKAYRIDASSV